MARSCGWRRRGTRKAYNVSLRNALLSLSLGEIPFDRIFLYNPELSHSILQIRDKREMPDDGYSPIFSLFSDQIAGIEVPVARLIFPNRDMQ